MSSATIQLVQMLNAKGKIVNHRLFTTAEKAQKYVSDEPLPKGFEFRTIEREARIEAVTRLSKGEQTMPSPVLEGKYHHPSATPTPSNHQIVNSAVNSGHQCCGMTFTSEADFKKHFNDVHNPLSANYKPPVDYNAKKTGTFPTLAHLDSIRTRLK